MLSPELRNRLDKAAYCREDPSVVQAAMVRLGITPPSEFVEFYQSYRGPFWSTALGVEFSDLVEGDLRSVVELTEFGRERLGLPNHLVVLSDLATGATILVFDPNNDQVFVVNFEGGYDELIRGELAPSWFSFRDFLGDYFADAQPRTSPECSKAGEISF